MKLESTDDMPVMEAALSLRISRERVIRLIRTGELRGRRIPGVGWVAERDSVTARRAEQDSSLTNSNSQ